MPCGLLLSSLPFPTIAYQRVCWGRGPQQVSNGCSRRPTASACRSRFRARLSGGVRLLSNMETQIINQQAQRSARTSSRYSPIETP